MSPRVSSAIGWFVLVAAFLLPASAQAWIETSVRSHQARVEVEADGRATIRHELLLKVRGGPMKFLEIDGIGSDIEALPDAVVRRASEGSSSKWPLSLSAMEDGGLRLGIGAQRGLRGGSYLFHFAYQVDLEALGHISRGPERAELTWIGPRLSSGVDSAKVTFVVPRGKQAPRLVQAEDVGVEVLLGEVRRGESFDEVELVRAHLATGEPAVWKVELESDVLSAVPLSTLGVPKDDVELKSYGRTGTLYEGTPRVRLLWAAGLSLAYGLLVFLKAYWVRRDAARVEARAKPLLPAPPWFRGVINMLLIVLAAHFAFDQRPWIAVALGGLALLNATFLLPSREVKARGPGRWIQAPKLLPDPRVFKSPAVIFETTKAAGFTFLLILSLPILALAYRILPVSNYLALMTMSFALLLLPLFWTGRLRDLPQGALEQARPWLRVLERALDPKLVGIELWGRVSSGGDEAGVESSLLNADEARLRVVFRQSPRGLRALEISFEETVGAGVQPCILLRVTDDSPAKDRLPTEIPWQRGRSSDERVALLRPTAPTRAQLLRLLRSLIGNLRGASQVPTSGNPESRRHRRSSARLDSLRNEGTCSPAQAI